MSAIQLNEIPGDNAPLTPVYGTPIDHPGAPDQRLRYLRALQPSRILSELRRARLLLSIH